MRATVLILASVAAQLAGCSTAESLVGRDRPARGGAAGIGGGATEPPAPTTPPIPAGAVADTGTDNEPSAAAAHDTASETVPVGDGNCGAVVQAAENTRQPVDVVFAIDTSGSMSEEIGFVHENMNAFSQQIRASGIDARVVLIATEQVGTDDLTFGLFTDGICIDAPLGSGSCPMDSNPPDYVHIPELIGQWNILDSYVYLYPMYKQYLRPDSLKTLVSISDDDASTGADKFLADVQALDPGTSVWAQWRYSAIYPFEACLGSFGIGTTHRSLVERTQGVAGDLCLQDFRPVFDAIATQLVESATLACDWEIPPPPNGETFEPTETNVRLMLDVHSQELLKSQHAPNCLGGNGWYYDDDITPRRVLACPATCAQIQAANAAEVQLLFGCATRLGPA